jgi:hypothetical protein
MYRCLCPQVEICSKPATYNEIVVLAETCVEVIRSTYRNPDNSWSSITRTCTCQEFQTSQNLLDKMSVRGDCADYNRTSVFDGSIIMRSPSDP